MATPWWLDVVGIAGLIVAFFGALVGAVWCFATFVLALSDAVHGAPDLDGIHGHEETVVRFDVACADGSVLHAAGLFDRDEAECWVRSTDYRRPCGPHRVVERHAPP